MSDDLQTVSRMVKSLKWLAGAIGAMLVGSFSAGVYLSDIQAAQRTVVERQATLNAEIMRRIEAGDSIDKQTLDELKNNKAILSSHEVRINGLETDMRDVRNTLYGRVPR